MTKNYDEWDIDEDYLDIWSLAELEALEGYLKPQEYDVTTDPVVAICGEYHIEQDTPCALPDHTAHRHGWVGRTEIGFKVAVGCICAGHHIQNIAVMTSRATHKKQLRQFRDKIAQTLETRDNVRTRLQRLKEQPYGGDWLERNQAKIRLISKSVQNQLEERARQGNPVIHEYEELSDAEKDDLRAMGTGMRGAGATSGRRVECGRLAGLEVIRRQYKVEALEIHNRLSEIERGFDPQKGNKIYRRWAKWCGEFEKQFDRLEGLLLEGERFFEKENIALISRYIATTASARFDLARVKFELYKRPEVEAGRLSGSLAA